MLKSLRRTAAATILFTVAGVAAHAQSFVMATGQQGGSWYPVGGAIKAVAAFSVVFDEANLLNVAVHKTAQRKGLARKLLSECLAAYAGQGIKNCFLEVRRSNRPAINLYEQLGFTCIGERKNYYPVKGGREDALVLICQLQRKDTQRESQHA